MPLPADFYDLQKRQKFRSAAVIGLLLVFHILAVGLLMLAVWLTFGLFAVRPAGPGFWLKFAALDVLLAGTIAVFHYYDAKRNGAAFLLKRLAAKPPQPSDRYHRLFADAVEGIRIAAGLDRVDPLILPTSSLNSLALIQPGGRPAIVVTEGLLAECARDEVEAVVAHEAAHIARGDTTILTLVCGLSSFFERLRDALEPDDDVPVSASFRSRGSVGRAGFLFIAAFFGTGIIRLLGVFVSRERELLADAAAVEFGRSPMALARAVYKARARNVFIGDFSQAYAPLFLIAPSIAGEPGPPVPRWTSSHPPFRERISLLAGMAHQTAEAVSEQVREARLLREQSRIILSAPPPRTPSPEAGISEAEEWEILLRDGTRAGPLGLTGLLETPGFSPAARVRNLTEGLDGRAGDFPQIREALRRKRQGRPAGTVRFNLCPRCRVPLGSTHYEGVAVRICRRCGGKLVDFRDMNRIIARREVGFAEDVARKAAAYEQEHRLDPAAPKRKAAPSGERLTCPACGCLMRARPYNYQYFVPVDKCLSCGRIWFDADELEMLQMLIERARND